MQDAGYQLGIVQADEEPQDWKPFKAVGTDVRVMEMTTIEPNQNLFEVLGVPNATFEKMRLDLMLAIAKWFKTANISQTEAVELLECSQPQLNDILKFKYDKFSIERLLKIVEKTGQRAELNILEAA